MGSEHDPSLIQKSSYLIIFNLKKITDGKPLSAEGDKGIDICLIDTRGGGGGGAGGGALDSCTFFSFQSFVFAPLK